MTAQAVQQRAAVLVLIMAVLNVGNTVTARALSLKHGIRLGLPLRRNNLINSGKESGMIRPRFAFVQLVLACVLALLGSPTFFLCRNHV